ncbi:MAG: transcription antitermination factor NusB [Actinobacteria bacterium]|nr:transcription antitermination factor NusB [Actinomycetota bacterium]
MGRRTAREAALKVLFQVDVGKNDPEEALRSTIQEDGLQEREAGFAGDLVRGALSHLGEIDAMIAPLAVDWTLNRMANVDRNVLRLAVYEILYLDDIPASVSINEAVDLAKTYSTSESGKFVNGILGNIARRIGKDRPPSEDGGPGRPFGDETRPGG